MILVSLIGLLFIGGVAAWISERFDPRCPRVVALVAMLLAMVLVLALLNGVSVGNEPLASINASWMPRFGISFFLAADGLSGLLLLLTVFLGIVAIGSAWDEITERSGFFYFNLLWTLAGVLGVFVALDLFLFFFFWEVMLIPMYFIIAIWGHESKNYAAMKFFIFTQVTGMLMLVAIIVLAYFHYNQFGVFSFNY
ncbi:MAG: proton-conducting transporter membrane subunit, partial [Pseudomonadota bacterium]|nr:proton-conducting transporter membrane subunit [Pseudomonadota bacterium]